MGTRRKRRRRKRKIEFIVSWMLTLSFLLSLIVLGMLFGRSKSAKTEEETESMQIYAVQSENVVMEECTAKPSQIMVEVNVQISANGISLINADDTYISDEIRMLCVEIGNQTGYCPELLMSIIETESSGRQYAENGPCKGLMQINTDWPEISAYMKEHGYTDVYDCETNIRLGCYVLDQKREVYGDDIYAVLMGYNGSSNVMERVDRGDYTDYAVNVADRACELERLHGK